MQRPRKPAIPFKNFHSLPDVIWLVALMYMRFPLSLRNIEDLLPKRFRLWVPPRQARMTGIGAQSRNFRCAERHPLSAPETLKPDFRKSRRV